jgi:hypothetical protein
LPYLVTHGTGPVEIDQEVDLAEALAQARKLLAEGRTDVAIVDRVGRAIRGDELVACCRGRLKLTPDLRAIPNPVGPKKLGRRRTVG